MNTSPSERGTDLVKRGLAEMLKGGVIMDVVNVEQARIAEEAGAVAVMALERVPADIRAHGGVAPLAKGLPFPARRALWLTASRLAESINPMLTEY